MSHFHVPMKLAAAAALAAAIGLAGAPAHAALTVNALTVNALTVNALETTGSQLDQLNGVAVEGAIVAFDPKPIPPGEEE
jgi:hypothetical protein